MTGPLLCLAESLGANSGKVSELSGAARSPVRRKRMPSTGLPEFATRGAKIDGGEGSDEQLVLGEVAIKRRRDHELRVRSHPHDPAVVEHHDLVGIHHG